MQWLSPYGASDTKVLYEPDGAISTLVFSDDGKQLFVARPPITRMRCITSIWPRRV